MRAARVHPVYAALEAIERAWSDSDKQACERARAIALQLYALGHIEGELNQGIVCLRETNKGEANNG